MELLQQMSSPPLKTLDLFSGIGGFHYAGKLLGGFETTQFVESDPHAQTVLKALYPEIPIHGDIRTFHASPGQFDVITAGFPCQDISAAGKQAGLDGERSGLFFEIIRLVRECRPRYLLLENVGALVSSNGGRDMGAVLWELSQCGYDAEWQTIPAAAVGANHLRFRIWIIAYPNRKRSQWWDEKHTTNANGETNLSLTEAQSRATNRFSSTLNRSSQFLFPSRLGEIGTVPLLDDGIPPGLPRLSVPTAGD